MTPDEVIEEVSDSGLRGRGGGGFPAGRKWAQVKRQNAAQKYVVCNGDEGDQEPSWTEALWKATRTECSKE